MIEKVGNSSKTETTHDYNKLSVQVSLNGLSFCIVDTITKTIQVSDSLIFEKERTPYGLQKGLVSLFNKHSISEKSFSEIIVVHRNKLFCLVPKALFNEADMSNYLKFNTKILADDYLAHDELDSNDMVNVYIPFANINNYIYELFGSFTYKHSGSVMISALLSANQNSKEAICYVHVSYKQIEVTVIAEKKLVFYNIFDFNSKEDFVYYILFTYEQLQLNTDTTHLKLFGDIEEDDTNYNMCYTYIKNVSIHVPSMDFFPMNYDKEAIDFTVLNTL